MPLELFNTPHDVKKDYHWYINHPEAYHRVMSNRRRDVVHHFRHFQVPKQQAPPPVEEKIEEMTPSSEYPTIDVEEQ